MVRTLPYLFSSLTTRSSARFSTPCSIAMLTCTSLVLIRSTTTPKRSSTPKMPARNPCDTLLRLLFTFSTTMCSLIVTAVGCLCAPPPPPSSASSPSGRYAHCCAAPLAPRNADAACAAALASMSGSGWITVPPPLGFSTFLMRIGIFLRMTCSGPDVS